MKFYANIKKLFKPLVGLWITQFVLGILLSILFIAISVFVPALAINKAKDYTETYDYNASFTLASSASSKSTETETITTAGIILIILLIILAIVLFAIFIAILILTIFTVYNLYKISENKEKDPLIDQQIMSNAKIGFIVLLISLFFGGTIALPIAGIVFTHKVIKDIEKNKQEQEVEVVIN